MTLTLKVWGLSFIFRGGVRDVSLSDCNVTPVCLVCRWRRWRSTITAWPSARRGLRVKPTTSALTASRSTCAGTDMLPRYCVCMRVNKGRESTSICSQALLTGQLHRISEHAWLQVEVWKCGTASTAIPLPVWSEWIVNYTYFTAVHSCRMWPKRLWAHLDT